MKMILVSFLLLNSLAMAMGTRPPAPPQTNLPPVITTPPIAALAKQEPQGVVSLLPMQDGSSPVSKFIPQMQADAVWTNANVPTVQARAAWGVLETSKGVYDWSLFDAVIAKAQACGKKVALSVTFGSFTPAWVYTAGAVKQTITMNSGQLVTMPWPWDPAYQAQIKTFVTAFGKKYDGNPDVTYVAMSGMGRQQESYCVESPTDIANFDAIGGQQSWVTACAAIISDYNAAFPTTWLVMAIAPPTPDSTGAESLQAVVGAAETAIPHFGLRSDGLRPEYAQTATVGTLLTDYSANLTGFQCTLPAGSTPLSEYFSVGEQMNAKFVECFEGDVLNPSNQAALQQVNGAMK